MEKRVKEEEIRKFLTFGGFFTQYKHLSGIGEICKSAGLRKTFFKNIWEGNGVKVTCEYYLQGQKEIVPQPQNRTGLKISVSTLDCKDEFKHRILDEIRGFIEKEFDKQGISIAEESYSLSG